MAAAGLTAVLAEGAINAAMSLNEKDKKKHSLAVRVFAKFATGFAGLFPVAGQEIAGQIIQPALGLGRSMGDNPIMLMDLGSRVAQAVPAVAGQLLGLAEASEKPEAHYKAWLDLAYSAGALTGLPTPAAIDLGKRIKAGTPLPGLSAAESESDEDESFILPKRHGSRRPALSL